MSESGREERLKDSGGEGMLQFFRND